MKKHMNIYYFSAIDPNSKHKSKHTCQVDAYSKDMALQIAKIMFLDRFGADVNISDITLDDVDTTSHSVRL